MNSIVTHGIVLRRINFQEADRIVTLLTKNNGKLRLIAKGSRRSKSKLAGGIELFTIADIVYVPAKKDIGTLVSSRMQQNFAHISSDIDRTMLGYDMLKHIDKYTEDDADSEYFDFLSSALTGLNNLQLAPEAVKLWFLARLLRMSGHAPNTQKDDNGANLISDVSYRFDNEQMCFTSHDSGAFSPSHIKCLRVASAADSPLVFEKVIVGDEVLNQTYDLTRTIAQLQLGFSV